MGDYRLTPIRLCRRLEDADRRDAPLWTKLKMAKRKLQVPPSSPTFDLGEELLASVREMKSNVRARTHQPVISGIASARIASGLSQAAFASLMGVSVRTLQDWEQGRREPSGAARTLIKVAERHPEVLRELVA